MNSGRTDSDKINIDFTLFPFCFRTFTNGTYTNKLKDYSDFLLKFGHIFEKEVQHLSQYNFCDITTNTNKHSHDIKKNSSEYDLVICIIKSLYNSFKGGNLREEDLGLFLDNNINDYTIWQLGYSGGTRLFGVRKSNVFHVLFIDYHHLIYPDNHYNEPNFNSFSFCPITNY